jgi:hypothetical protein
MQDAEAIAATYLPEASTAQSARPSSEIGTVMPSALAVLRLMYGKDRHRLISDLLLFDSHIELFHQPRKFF